MHGVWLVSYIALWLMLILVGGVVLSLMRLIGQMNDRLGPAPALATEQGPEIGDSFSEILARFDVVEHGLFGFPRKRDSLVLFVTPGCVSCENLLRSVRPFRATRDPDVEVAVISTSANQEDNRELIENTLSGTVPFIPLPKIARSIGIRSTPYAFWLDTDGVVRAKGLVNTLEHLESLRNARISGYATLKEYHDNVHLGHESAPALSEGMDARVARLSG